MSFPVKTLVAGIVEGIPGDVWKQEFETVDRLVAGWGGMAGDSGADLPGSIPKLREALQTRAPHLAELEIGIKGNWFAGHSVIIIRNLGLAGAALPMKKRLLYAIACLLGRPSPPSPKHQDIVWDVRLKNDYVLDSKDYLSTFSEHAGDARYHTDRQFRVEPERYFILYVVEPASCGGGATFFQSAQALKDRLGRTSEGRSILDQSSRSSLPFRVPTTFMPEGQVVQVIRAPIFSGDVFVRWRYDTICAGIEQEHSLDAAELRQFVDSLDEVIEHPEEEYRECLPQDSICFVDNHRILHGRTAFEDTRRHLMRVAMHSARVH